MDEIDRSLLRVLAGRESKTIEKNGLTRAAVLVPVYHRNGEHHLLLTRRTEHLRNHKGQISFPGGGYQEEDGSLAETALRETAEELGLGREHVQIMGTLDDELTWVSNYIITPYVGLIPWPYRFKVNNYEIKEIIEVPFSALRDRGCCREEVEEQHGLPVKAYYFDYQGKIIWGATARILNQFLCVMEEALKPESGRQSG